MRIMRSVVLVGVLASVTPAFAANAPETKPVVSSTSQRQVANISNANDTARRICIEVSKNENAICKVDEKMKPGLTAALSVALGESVTLVDVSR